ncbi:MAG: tetratricopeptide repeat protein, partial [Planctomycetes bacterium]|nr:tetratricopeptide repeat protein [Planctomycetota bacterium]
TTLYEMLTERPPLQGKSHQETLAQIISRDPVQPRKLRPRVPRDLDTIVMKCLRKDPRDRFGTAEALAQDLRRFVRGDPIEARPQAPIEKLVRRAKRHAMKIGAAILLVLLAGVSALFIHQFRVRLAEGRAAEESKARSEYTGRIARAVSRIQIGEMNQHLAMNSPHRSDPADLFTGLRLDSITAPPSREELDAAILEIETAAGSVPPGFDGHDAYYHWARALDLRGEREAALEKLEHLLAIRPDFIPALVLAAEIQRELGRHEQAQATESRAEEAASSSPHRWAKAWYEGRRAERQKRWGDAVVAYGILMDSTADGDVPYEGFRMESRLRRGQARLAAKEPAGALADFSIASHEWPEAMEPRLYLGRVLHLQGEKEAARRTFEELHDSRPADQKDLAAAWIVLAYLYSHDWEAALDWAGKLSEAGLRERLRSFCLVRLERFGEAEEAARVAVGLDDSDAGAHLMVAVALHGQKKYAAAKESCRRAIELDPDHFAAYHTMGQLHYDWGEVAESIRWYERSIARNPRSPATLGNLGAALVQSGKAEEGFRLLEESYAIQRTSLCCASLALTHGILRRPGWETERRRLFEEAIRIDPKCWMALANLGVDLYMAEGKLLEGLEKLRRAAELNPGWHLTHAHLGRIYERLGLDDDAVEHYLLAGERVLRDTTPGDVQLGNIMRLGNTMAKASAYPEVRAKGIELLAGAARDERYSRWASVVSDYASALLACERYEEALAAFDRSVELDRGGTFALANRGICRGKLGRPREALEDFLESLELGGEGRFSYVAEHILVLFREHRGADFGEALDRLRAKLGAMAERGAGEAEALWNVWLMVTLWVDRRELPAVLDALDALAAKAPESGGDAVRARAAEVRWALEGWRDGSAIRINCGGGEHRDTSGVQWDGDRLFAGGLAHDVTQDPPPWSTDRGKISAAVDPAIYRTFRRFPPTSSGPAGYRVPVLPGDYRVTLHFVEMFSNPSQGCIFGVKLEEETALEKYKPRRAGVATADRKSFVVRGADALLGILLLPERGAPQICAIEIERQ